MKKHIIIFLILFSASSGFASENGGTESPFNFGFGARELALGGSNLTTVSPSTAMFWNSSQLASTEQFEITSYYSQLYDSDVLYQYLGIAYPTINYGTFGIGISRLGVSGIDKRDENNFDLGDFNDTRLGIYLAFGKRMVNYDVGLMLNIEQHSIDDYKNTSSPGLNFSISRHFELDIDFIHDFKTIFRYANFLKPSLKLNEESNSYPSKLEIGFSTEIITPELSDNSLLLYSHLTKTEDISTQLSLGLEFELYNMLTLRGGLREQNYSFGAGINYQMFKFDYALVNRDFGAIHMFSLTSSFGTSLSEKRENQRIKDEQNFNKLMSSRLIEKNNRMIADLKESGNSNLADNNLTEAISDFERALFLIKSNNQDTVQITSIIQETRMKLQLVEQENSYTKWYDSAQVCYQDMRYIDAKFFANSAIEIKPNSVGPQLILDSCEYYITKQLTESTIFAEKLLEVDSLLSYGSYIKANRIISELKELSPNDKNVDRLFVRSNFEQHRNNAEEAFASNDFKTARMELDFASHIYPGHKWCTDFERLLIELVEPVEKIEQLKVISKSPIVLSEKMKQKVSELYKVAQNYFENGDLESAVDNWEEVEDIIPDYQSTRKYLINAYKYIGIELYGNSQFSKAIVVWKKAQKLDPSNDEIANYINRTTNELKKMKAMTYGETK